MIGGVNYFESIVLVVLGGLTAFFGYRFMRLVVVVIGFALGALAGHTFMVYMGFTKEAFTLIGATIGGMIVALMMFPTYLLGVFTLGAASGLVLGRLLELGPEKIILLFLMITGGLMAVLLQKPLIIALTAVDGAALLMFGVLSLYDPLHWSPHSPWSAGLLPGGFFHSPLAWLMMIFLAAIGAAFQFRDTRHFFHGR